MLKFEWQTHSGKSKTYESTKNGKFDVGVVNATITESFKQAP